MKKMLTFIPLALGISAALIYLFNVLQFKMVGNAMTLLEAFTRLRLYLYIAIVCFIIYFIIKIIEIIILRKKTPVLTDSSYEPFEKTEVKDMDTYVPNYDYVPIYNKEDKKEEKIIVENIVKCCNCKKKINEDNRYCPHCGANQIEKQRILSPFIKRIINVLEIVILILVIYFLLNMLFDFKEKQDPSFRSPFKVSMTK